MNTFIRSLFNMHKLLDTSTAAIPTGVPPQRKLLMIETGPYMGRLFCLYNESSDTIAVTWSDPPYTIWADPYNQITDSADYPPSACIDAQGNIYVVYVQQTTLDIVFFKLSLISGSWQSGTHYTVLDTSSAYYPVIVRNDSGVLWCGFSYYNPGTAEYEIRVKSSTDGGQTWGSGPSDLGDLISASSISMPYVCLEFAGSDLYAVFTENRSNLNLRKRATAWESTQLVYSGDYIDADFDLAVSSDMKLGIVFAPSGDERVYYREFDGVALGGLQEVFQDKTIAPQILFKNNRPYILFARDVGNNCYLPKCSYYQSGQFTSIDLISSIGFFDSLFLYESSGQTFEDKTTEAQSEMAADIYHSSSNSLLSAEGDCLYLGKEEKFFSVSIILSTSGSGGSVAWEYYNGQAWSSFSPQAGDIDFDEIQTVLYLWNDEPNIPGDWQINSVNGTSKFWIRARVVNDFSVAPVGSQITAIPKCGQLSLARGVS